MPLTLSPEHHTFSPLAALWQTATSFSRWSMLGQTRPRRTSISSESKTPRSQSIGRCCHPFLPAIGGRTRTDHSSAAYPSRGDEQGIRIRGSRSPLGGGQPEGVAHVAVFPRRRRELARDRRQRRSRWRRFGDHYADPPAFESMDCLVKHAILQDVGALELLSPRGSGLARSDANCQSPPSTPGQRPDQRRWPDRERVHHDHAAFRSP
jgi:hypothetical protein